MLRALIITALAAILTIIFRPFIELFIASKVHKDNPEKIRDKVTEINTKYKDGFDPRNLSYHKKEKSMRYLEGLGLTNPNQHKPRSSGTPSSKQRITVGD